MPPVKHIRLTAEQETNLQSYLEEKISDLLTRREQRTRDWKRWRENYEGKTTPKNFPWKDSSNVWVPLTAITTDAIHANMMNRIFGHDRIWDANAVRPTEVVGKNTATDQDILWSDLAKATQEYLKAESAPKGLIDVYQPTEDAILECIKLGTSILYNPWITRTQPDFSFDETSGQILRNQETVLWDGLQPKNIPLEDFLILPNYADIHGPSGSPLIGHQYYLRRGQVIANYKQGRYRSNSERLAREKAEVLATPGGPVETLKDAQDHAENESDTTSNLRRDDYLFQDLWLRVQLDESGYEYSIFVTRHHETGHIVRIQPWPYETIPYHALRYIRREGRFYGIGIPEMMESLQAGINTSFNQTVDNASIANMRGFKIKRGTGTSHRFLDTLNDIYPGKKFFVDNMEDIQEFQLGEVYPSAFQVGLEFWNFGEKRSGISDYNLGRESSQLGRHSTATTTLALLQENARRFDLYSKDIRRALGELGMQSIELIQQYRPEAGIWSTMGESAPLVSKAILDNPQHDIRKNLRIVATATSSEQSKEIARQNSLTAFGLLAQYLERVFQLAMFINNQQVPEPLRRLAYQMAEAGELLMRRILEDFDLAELAARLPQIQGVPDESGPGQEGAAGPSNMGGGPGTAMGGASGPPGGPTPVPQPTPFPGA